MTEEAYSEFRREFENNLAKYAHVVEDRALFVKCMEYGSSFLSEAEHSIRKNLMEMYVGMLDIVRQCEEKGWKND